MPKPLNAMLSKWPHLYPEIAGAGQQDDARTAMPTECGKRSPGRCWTAAKSLTLSLRIWTPIGTQVTAE